MSSYLDGLKQELVAAGDRLAPIAPMTIPRRRWWRRSPRVLFAALACLAVSATAIAATTPWQPIFGDPAAPQRVVVSGSAPPAEQLALLGVLRRSQTEEDRGDVTRQALRYFGTSTQGVYTNYIRRLSAAGELPAVLVPARSWHLFGLDENDAQVRKDPRMRKLLASARAKKQDVLCVFVLDPVDGGAKGCYTTAELRRGTAGGGLGAMVYGLVPDGVAQVRFDSVRGAEVVAVHDNFYEYRATAGSGSGELMRSRGTTWLDDEGQPTADQPILP